MTSINTNTGSAIALQMLGGNQQALSDVQQQVATGQEIRGPQDNPALWALSQVMEADAAAFESVSDSLALGEATLNVASVGAEQVQDTLVEMKELAALASGGMVDFSKIQDQMAAKTEQIGSIIQTTQFNGVSLLKTDIDGAGSTSLSIASSLDRAGSANATLDSIVVDSVDFEGSAQFDLTTLSPITDAASASAALGQIEGFLNFAIEGAAYLGSQANRVSNQQSFVSKLSDSMKQGVGNLVDANMAEAATKLAALGTQQKLGTMSLSIANAMPGALEKLY